MMLYWLQKPDVSVLHTSAAKPGSPGSAKAAARTIAAAARLLGCSWNWLDSCSSGDVCAWTQ